VWHPIRHRRAIERVREAAPRKVLVMCLGNICRSPYAAGALSREVPQLTVRSAGFLDSGRPAPRQAVSVSAEHGVNLSAHLSAQVTREAAVGADLVLVMDARQAARVRAISQHRAYVERLGDFDPGPIDTRTIIDPIDRDRDFFERIYARIDACCRVLGRTIREG
jgi:protein-tyrosine phosphatase